LQKIKNDGGEEQKNRIKELLEVSKLRLFLLGYDNENIEKLNELGEPDKNLIYPGTQI
jgi:hypothetical protein